MNVIFLRLNDSMLKNYFKKILFNLLIVLIIFTFDRLSKLYILNLTQTDQLVNIYINPFLNLHLILITEHDVYVEHQSPKGCGLVFAIYF